ncbi:MAG: Fpg/Nei family DNA glycosylase [Sandaracinaceae bacterium]
MPEGDTIHRSANRLRSALEGCVLTGFESPRKPALEANAELVGRRIDAVEARGKYLLVRFDDGRTLETHMKMNGSWHLYRPRERWRGPASDAVAVLHTEAFVAVCFRAPICRLVRGLSSEVRRLGPDLLDPAADLDEAVRRMRAEAELPLGVAVMRQDLVAGIGNVYKSEVLFEQRLDPFQPVADVASEELVAMLSTARRHLRRNLRTRFRGTRRIQGTARLWVYERSGEPCYGCGTVIEMRRQGPEMGRSTYFCPRCQSPDAGAFSPDAGSADPQ